MAKHQWLEQLAPRDAADRFKDDPDSVLLRIPDLMKMEGLTEAQMLKELQTGRLTAVAVPDGNGRSRVFITGKEATRWLAARMQARKVH